MNIFIEYIIVFILIYTFYYFFITRHNQEYNKKQLPAEVLYFKKIYKVNITKDIYKSFLNIITIVNTFIITTTYIILIYLLNNWIARILVGVVLLILMIIICYGILARYYLKKEGR